MAISKLWAGRVFGTNTGNVFLRLEGSNDSLNGTFHFNEPDVGIVVYVVQGSFDGAHLKLSGDAQSPIEGFDFGRVTASATLDSKGELRGTWETTLGSAGTVVLFPHDRDGDQDSGHRRPPDQLHTARHQFGAMKIDRVQILALAAELQREFTRSQVVVTVVTDTERSRLLPDFQALQATNDKASAIKLFAQEPEEAGLNRVVNVELGPHTNFLTVQGGDEAWVLGVQAKLRRSLSASNRNYVTSYKKFGFGINQLLLTAAIVLLPSLHTIRDRAILMVGILLLILAVNWLDQRFLPPAVVYLGKSPPGLLTRIGPGLISWTIAATAGLAAALLATYLFK